MTASSPNQNNMKINLTELDENGKPLSQATDSTNGIKQPKKSKRKLLITIFLIIIILIGTGYYYYKKFLTAQTEGTDNAYVNGNVVIVNSEVNGTVISIKADNTQFVKEGSEIIKLDPLDSNVNLNEATAALAATVRNLKQQYANVKQYPALITQQKLAIEKARQDYNRRKQLIKQNLISKEEFSHYKIALESAKAALKVTLEQEKAAKASIAGVKLVNHPNVLEAKARFIKAWITAKRNVILAPVSGYVALRSVQVGARVTPGQALLSIVPLKQLWIDANFKENQLTNIRIGQPVRITTDIYGDNVVFHGKVVGLSAGTGSAFSLLPAQNATGNWIKIVQRVPVRISLSPKELQEHPLRIGLSATVSVDTHNQNGNILSNAYSTNTTYSTTATLKTDKKAEQLADKIITKNAGNN